MKILALAFLLFGIAAAFSHEDLERATDEAILSFMHGMEKAPSLREAMNMNHPELDEVEDEIKTELVKTLREALEHLLKRIKEAVDHGKMVKEEMKEHVEKIKEQLRKLHEDIGNKARELLERIADKVKGKIREWIDKLRGKGFSEYSEEYEITKMLQEAEDSLHTLEKASDRLHSRKVLRDAKDLFEKIKDYLKEAREDFEHHFSTFLDWLEKVYKSGVDAAKGRLENVKKVARKFLDHVKEVGKKTADEALEFFRPYKKDLGTLWDELEKAIKETYGKH